MLQATEMALWFAAVEVGSVEAVAVAWGLTLGWCLYLPLVEVGRRMGLSFVGKGLSGQCYRRHRRKRKNPESWFGRLAPPSLMWRVRLARLS